MLTLNSGSSAVKFGVYRGGATDEEPLLTGSAEDIGRKSGKLHIRSSDGNVLAARERIHESQRLALAAVAEAIKEHIPAVPVPVGHRTAHGAPKLRTHHLITPQHLKHFRYAIHFAPLRLP